jgi:GntR family transcriptional regulator
LHGQLSRQLREKILAGDLSAGTSLPSIRMLASEQRVSVITVQRAYEDLEREGLIYSRRGKGFFVAKLSDDRKQEMAAERLTEAIAPVIAEALSAGLTIVQVEDVVGRILLEKGK